MMSSENQLRREATIEQWRALYEVATRIKELKLWDKFWDMDLIGIRDGAEVPKNEMILEIDVSLQNQNWTQ